MTAPAGPGWCAGLSVAPPTHALCQDSLAACEVCVCVCVCVVCVCACVCLYDCVYTRSATVGGCSSPSLSWQPPPAAV